jgi:hypothetical protein
MWFAPIEKPDFPMDNPAFFLQINYKGPLWRVKGTPWKNF